MAAADKRTTYSAAEVAVSEKASYVLNEDRISLFNEAEKERDHNHKNPYMLSTVPKWVWDFYKFTNSAVLISAVADRINYEKVREW